MPAQSAHRSGRTYHAEQVFHRGRVDRGQAGHFDTQERAFRPERHGDMNMRRQQRVCGVVCAKGGGGLYIRTALRLRKPVATRSACDVWPGAGTKVLRSIQRCESAIDAAEGAADFF